MADARYDELLANITRILSKHGYPAKRVALPLERMYEVAYKLGLNFNKALALLAERGIAHESSPTRIVFFPADAGAPAAAGAAPPAADPLAAFAGMDEAALSGMGMGEMVAKANELLKSMPPEQRQQIEAFYRTMTDEQKAEMLKKAKDLGID